MISMSIWWLEDLSHTHDKCPGIFIPEAVAGQCNFSREVTHTHTHTHTSELSWRADDLTVVGSFVF